MGPKLITNRTNHILVEILLFEKIFKNVRTKWEDVIFLWVDVIHIIIFIKEDVKINESTLLTLLSQNKVTNVVGYIVVGHIVVKHGS